jgi:hypothetical protein
LIGGTGTKTGLKVKAVLDTNPYETGVDLSKKDMDQLLLTSHKTHPDWNYTLSPRTVVLISVQRSLLYSLLFNGT